MTSENVTCFYYWKNGGYIMEYAGMIDKYAPKIMELRDMENTRAEMRAGLIIMQIMDETMKEVKEKVGNLYSELIMR